MPSPCVIGVDLGGTNVRAQAYDAEGQESGPRVENPSHAQHGTKEILDALARTIRQAADGAHGKPCAIGLAIPGHVDNHAGVVKWAPNFGESRDGVFECWRDVAIREPLRHLIDLPLSMGNDANMAALGEYMYGSGGGQARSFVMFTLGTGIGGGVVLSPHAVQGHATGPLLLVGGNGGGAELGHTVIIANGLDCNAGSYGAVEAYCGRDGIIRRAVHRLQRGRVSLIRDLVEGDLARVTPRLISEAAEQGDELALEVYHEVGEFLGIAIGNMIAVFAPDLVAIGGQVARAAPFLLDHAVRSARNVAPDALFRDVRIVVAERLDDAGILGAAALAHHSTSITAV